MKVVCVGDLGVDRYMPENKLLPGGITGNFTRQARRTFEADDDVHIISMMGNDKEAKVAMEAISVPGITRHFNHVAGPTPVQFIEILDNGEKNFTRYDAGILKKFDLNEDQKQVMSDADIIMTPVYWQIYNVFEIVMSVKTGATIAVDFSDFATDPDFGLIEKYGDKVDIAFFGLSKTQTQLIAEITDTCLKKDILAVITLGPEGNMAIKDGISINIPAITVDKIIDTTGAGDAFAAGFLSHYMKNLNVKEALRKGADVAAQTIRHVGSVPPQTHL